LSQVDFSNSEYFSDYAPNLNGSFIHIGGYWDLAEPEVIYAPLLNISSCSFKMGMANYGAAVYIAGLPLKSNLSLYVNDTEFYYNKAVINGGAFYFDDLDLYNISINNVNFKENLVGLYGDNIYAKQT
jgi:hypothetical protein